MEYLFLFKGGWSLLIKRLSIKLLFYQMNGILFIDFNLAAYVFLKFDWCKMLNVYVDFSFNIFTFRMTVVSVETLEN